MQFLGAQVMDQYLDRMTSEFTVMLKAAPIHTQTLGGPILYQVV